MGKKSKKAVKYHFTAWDGYGIASVDKDPQWDSALTDRQRVFPQWKGP